jgi:hypothetical protein
MLETKVRVVLPIDRRVFLCVSEKRNASIFTLKVEAI